MELTEQELQDSKIGYPIYLPKSEHAVGKAAFSDRFWQQRPHKEKNNKGVLEIMKAAGVLVNMAGAVSGVNVETGILDKNLVKVMNGKNKSSLIRGTVLKFIKEKAVNDLHTRKFCRQEKLDVPDDSPIKSIDTHYYIFHLAVLYNSKEILEIFYDVMKSNKELCQMALELKVETSIDPAVVDISGNFFKLRDEVCAPTSLFLAIKYNPEALQQLVKIADAHGIMDDILKSQRDYRDFNLLQFATKNKSINSLRLVNIFSYYF